MMKAKISNAPTAITRKIHRGFALAEQVCGGSKNTVKDVPERSYDLTDGRLQVVCVGEVTKTFETLEELWLQDGEETRTRLDG